MKLTDLSSPVQSALIGSGFSEAFLNSPSWNAGDWIQNILHEKHMFSDLLSKGSILQVSDLRCSKLIGFQFQLASWKISR